MILIALMPDQSQIQIQVADTDLVLDGRGQFVEPQFAEYVALFHQSVDALSLPFDGIETQILQAEVQISAKVLQQAAYPAAETSPLIITQPGPADTDGQCVCFVTCTGTALRFVQVHTVPNN